MSFEALDTAIEKAKNDIEQLESEIQSTQQWLQANMQNLLIARGRLGGLLDAKATHDSEDETPKAAPEAVGAYTDTSAESAHRRPWRTTVDDEPEPEPEPERRIPRVSRGGTVNSATI